MRRYSLTSTQFKGEVILEFNELGLLSKYDASGAELDERQTRFLTQSLPAHENEVKDLLTNTKTATLTEVLDNISFDDFWHRYNDKIRSSKKKAEAVWSKLSKADQVKAFRFITRYESNLGTGIAKKYAETYLRAEQWNN